MVCHSDEFVLSVLLEKPYFNRLSDYLIEQILGLGCNDFARLRRAIDAVETGSSTTRNPGDFSPEGLLKGYGHFHYMKEDWAATNLAAINKQPIAQSVDDTIDHLVDKIVAAGGSYDAALEKETRKFSRRSREASGDWVLYRNGPKGREYLALSAHVDRCSDAEHELRRLLDGIAVIGDEHNPQI